MLDTPFILVDTEEADWAELSPEGSVFEMDDTRRTPERSWTRLVQYNLNNTGAVVLDLTTKDGQEGLETLKKLFEDGATMVVHNSLYDLPKLWKLGVYPKFIFDTLTASQTIWCGDPTKKHNLEAVIERETGKNPYSEIVEKSAIIEADRLVAALAGQAKTLEEREAHYNNLIAHGKKILQKSNWGREVLTPEQIAYAMADVGTEYWDAFMSLYRQIDSLGLEHQFALDMQVLPIVAQMHLDGIKFNLNKWKKYIEEQAELDTRLQDELHKQLCLWNQQLFPDDYLITLRRKKPVKGKPARYRKDGTMIRAEVPDQVVGDLMAVQPSPAFIPYDAISPDLFAREVGDVRIGGLVRRELGLEPGDTVKITQPLLLRKIFNAMLGCSGEGFDEEQVTNLIEKAEAKGMQDAADWLRKYQAEAKLRKLISTYGASYWKYCDSRGYIHARFSTTDADTSRIQASEPNVLNMPRQLQKLLWCVEEGEAMLKCDYSAQEARLVFYLGNQLDIYHKLVAGMDLHSMTLSFIMGVPYDELVIKTEGKKDKIKPELEENRIHAKKSSFAPMYGAQANKMAKVLEIDHGRAVKFVENYWKTYPEVKKMQDLQAYKAIHLGYVTDLSFGRKRFFFRTQKEQAALDMGMSLEEACFNRRNPAYNYAAQATGASILRFALLRLTQMVKDHPEWGAVIRLTVHDAVIMSCKAEYAEACGAEMRRQMEIAATEVVPGISIPVDLDIILDKTAPATFTTKEESDEQTHEEEPLCPTLWEEYQDGKLQDAGALSGVC
jgi:hypothetical protein